VSMLKDLSAAMSAWISYQRRDGQGTQGPLDTFARGWDSCRDIAVPFIEAARCLGFDARIGPDMFSTPLRLATPWLGPRMPIRSMRGRESICLVRVGLRLTRPIVQSEVPVSSQLPRRATPDRSFRRQADSLVPPATFSR
jgi:hypothetical protein